MRAAVLMVLASWLFATMGVTVKMASALYSTGEIVFYRGLIGVLLMQGNCMKHFRSVFGHLATVTRSDLAAGCNELRAG